MSWFIKTEKFNKKAIGLSSRERTKFISEHVSWVKKLSLSGVKIASGYLVDKDQHPGGGGLLILEADSYEKAKKLIIKDPIIKNQLVDWKLEEWLPVYGELLITNSTLGELA